MVTRRLLVECRMLELVIVLGCVLTLCSAAEYIDDTWIYPSAGGRGRATVLREGVQGGQSQDFPSATVRFVNFYRYPMSFMSGKMHPVSMLYHRPAWYHSKHAEEAVATPASLVLDGQVGILRRRLFDEVKDAGLTPLIRETSETMDGGDIPGAVDGPGVKRNFDYEDDHPQRATCDSLETYLCRGMNHPMCLVRYPAPASTRGNSRCRVFVRCNYTSAFFSDQGFCFAIRKAFPPPEIGGIYQATYRYNYTVKLYGTHGLLLTSYEDENVTSGAKDLTKSTIDLEAPNGLKSFTITTDYVCEDMTPCVFRT